jgi:hypothetical protein
MYDFVVLDHRCLRNSRYINTIKNSDYYKHLAITNDLLIEIFQKETWDIVLKKTLLPLSTIFNKLIVTLPVGNLRVLELQLKLPIKAIIDIPSTNILKNYLEELINVPPENIKDKFSEDISGAQNYVSNLLLNHERNAQTYNYFIQDFKQNANEDLLIALRKNKLSNKDIYENIIHRVDKMFSVDNQYFSSFSENQLNLFLSEESIHYRIFSSLLLYTFNWEVKRGIEQYPAMKITHDMFDQNNAIIATYGLNFKSSDTNAKKFYNDLMAIMNLRFEKNIK